MFPKPKDKDLLEFFRTLTTLVIVIAFLPYVFTLLLNISSEKVNPLLWHIIFGKMCSEMNCVFKVSNRTTEIGVKYVQR